MNQQERNQMYLRHMYRFTGTPKFPVLRNKMYSKFEKFSTAVDNYSNGIAMYNSKLNGLLSKYQDEKLENAKRTMNKEITHIKSAL